MHILTICLQKDQSDAITCELGEIVCTVDNLEDACALVHKEDFLTIVYHVFSGSPDLAEITRLVGLTLVSTRIILIGETELLKSIEEWRGLGVELLPDPTVDELIQIVREKSKKVVPPS